MAEDRQVVGVARRLRELAEDDADLAASQRAVRQALLDHDEQTRQLIRQRQAEYARLLLAESELNRRSLRRMEARTKLATLRRQHAGLLSAELQPV
jgi:hypothetical protein